MNGKEIRMKDRKNQTTTNNEVNLQSEALTDLPVADEQANQTKAGASQPNGRLFLGTKVGVF
jgi:hypothetical protein